MSVRQIMNAWGKWGVKNICFYILDARYVMNFWNIIDLVLKLLCKFYYPYFLMNVEKGIIRLRFESRLTLKPVCFRPLAGSKKKAYDANVTTPLTIHLVALSQLGLDLPLLFFLTWASRLHHLSVIVDMTQRNYSPTWEFRRLPP